MKISVIITSYNQRNFLVEAIESVLAQTVPCFEILVVDDCSADGSQAVIEDYARSYPNQIRPFLHTENLGIPRNRNFALERARGDSVSVLDGDDRFVPEKNERELEVFNRRPEAAVAYSDLWFVDHLGRRIIRRDRTTAPSGDVFTVVSIRGFGVLRSMLVRRSALKQVGYLDERFWHYDGFDLAVRLAKLFEFVYVPEALVEHRIHAEGASRAICSPSIAARELRAIYEKNRRGLNDIPRWEADLVRRTWARHLARLEGEVAWNEGRRILAMRLWWRAFRIGCARVLAPSLLGRVATSERARSVAQWSLARARRRVPRSAVTGSGN